MATREWAKKFYSSTAWRRCRASYATSKHGLCEQCGDVGTEVHHKIPLTKDNINDPMISLCWDNLQLLCHRCHDKTKVGQRSPVRDGYSFGPDGDLVFDG